MHIAYISLLEVSGDKISGKGVLYVNERPSFNTLFAIIILKHTQSEIGFKSTTNPNAQKLFFIPITITLPFNTHYPC